MFKHMDKETRKEKLMNLIKGIKPLSPGSIEAFEILKRETDAAREKYPHLLESMKSLAGQKPSPQWIEAIETFKNEQKKWDDYLNITIEPETPEEPKASKLRLKKISGINLVTLTIMVLKKNSCKSTSIENKTSFSEELISAVKIDKNYNPESFRTVFINLTGEGRDYPLELEEYQNKKFRRLEKFLQGDSGKEFEKIVMNLI